MPISELYVWDEDCFSSPEDARDHYGMEPGDVLALYECKVIVTTERRWKVQSDQSLEPLVDDEMEP